MFAVVFVAGISVLLIPFSFDFVDALCIAAVLGFISGKGDRLINEVNFRQLFCFGGGNNKVAISAETELTTLDCESGSISAISDPFKRTFTKDPLGRRHTMMHIHSAPQTPVRVERQAGAAAARGSKENIFNKMYGARRILKNLPFPGGSFTRSRLSSTVSESFADQPSANNMAKDRNLGGNPTTLHWGLALAAVMQLVLNAASDQLGERV